MAYIFAVTFHSDHASAEFVKSLPIDQKLFMITNCKGRELTVQSVNASHAYTLLVYIRHSEDIESIVLHDDEGWECEEIDLMNAGDMIALSHMINGGESGTVPPLAGLYTLLEADNADPDLHDEYGCILACKSFKDPPRLILASQSPRRKELLSLTGIPFTAEAADVDEEALTSALKYQFSNEPFSVMAAMIVMNLARAKAQKILDTHQDAVVIGSDTIVTIDTSILGKPTSSEDAFGMLRSLSGRDHHVFTGVSIVSRCKVETFFTVTRVGFYPWSQIKEDLAHRYIETGSPLDKAGAYGIQDMGALFIRGIKGDYYTVMGLPVSAVYNKLMDFGISMDL